MLLIAVICLGLLRVAFHYFIAHNVCDQGGRKKCPGKCVQRKQQQDRASIHSLIFNLDTDILPLVEYMLQKYDENNRRYTVYGLAQTVRAVLVEKFGVEVATIDATKRHSSHTFDGHTFDEYYRRTLDLHLRKVEEGTRSNDLGESGYDMLMQRRMRGNNLT